MRTSLCIFTLLCGCASGADQPPDLELEPDGGGEHSFAPPAPGPSGDACATDADCPRGFTCEAVGTGEFIVRECVLTPSVDVDLGDGGPGDADEDSGPLGQVDATIEVADARADDAEAPPVDAFVPPDADDEPSNVVRTVTLTPEEATLGTDVKVVLVVDNSVSMAGEQDRMAEGARRMMTTLRTLDGLSVEFFLYTTDAYRDWMVDKWTSDQRTQTTWDVDGSVHEGPLFPPDFSPLSYEETAELRPPYNGPVRLRFTADASDAQFGAATDALEAAIRAIGTGGSDSEAGLCTMSQTIVGLGPNRFLDAGDNVAFVLLSDADEASADSICPGVLRAHYVRETVPSSTRTTNAAEATEARFIVRKLQYNYGVPASIRDPETGETREYVSTTREIDFDPAAYGVPNVCLESVECPPALVSDIRAGTGANVTTCTITCGVQMIMSLVAPAYDLTRDYCSTAYDRDGRHFASVMSEAAAMGIHAVPSSCTSIYFKDDSDARWASDRYTAFTSHQLLPPHAEGLVGGGLEERLTEALPAYFGDGNYFVSAIVHDGRPSCDTTSEAVGRRYLAFVDGLGSAGMTQSICDTDYSATMEGLRRFIQRSVQSRFTVVLGEGERVGRVILLRADGSEVEVTGSDLLVIGSDVLVTGSLRVESGDQVRVEIVGS